MASWFWVMIASGLVIAMWESVGAIEAAIILVDILAAIFYGHIPMVVYPTLFLINIIVFAKALFFKPIAPQIQQ